MLAYENAPIMLESKENEQGPHRAQSARTLLIEDKLDVKMSARKIAFEIGEPPSTINRDIKLNGFGL